MQQTEQTFRQFCENELSARQFNSLYEIPNTTKHSITKALKQPQKMPYALLVLIAQVLELPAIELTKGYECGLDTMTAREYLSLLD